MNYKKYAGREPAQKFELRSPEWQWSEKKGEPVVVGMRDDFEYIQSNADCELTKVLDKFLPEEVEERFPVVNRVVREKKDLFSSFDTYSNDLAPEVAERAQSDLDALQEVAGLAEDMREEYGFPSDWSYGKIFDEVQKRGQRALKSLKRGDGNGSDRVVAERVERMGRSDIGSDGVDLADSRAGQNQSEATGKDNNGQGGEEG